MGDSSNLTPAYLQGLAASNRLTDARGEVYRLLTELPPHKRRAVIRIYNQLCSIQGTLENLLEDIPPIVHVETDENRKGSLDGE